MGDSFAQRSTATKRNPVNPGIVDQHDDVNTRSQSQGHSHEVQKDQRTQEQDKQDVLQLLRGKLDRGEHLQGSEQLLFQALVKESANKVQTGTQKQLHQSEEQSRLSEEQPRISEEQPHLQQQQPHLLPQQQQEPQKPQWFENAREADTSLLSKETRDLINKIGGNIPAPPFINDDFNQQVQQHNGATAAKPPGNQDTGDDQKSFEQDQREEERRLYEMFQGDTHHVKGDINEGDSKLFDKEDEEYGDKNEDDYEEKDGQDHGGNADNDNYNEKDNDYMYGDQKHQVKPAVQVDNNALI